MALCSNQPQTQNQIKNFSSDFMKWEKGSGEIFELSIKVVLDVIYRRRPRPSLLWVMYESEIAA